MATSRQYLINASTRHAVFVQRFAGSQLKEAMTYINKVRDKAIRQIAGKPLTEYSKKRLDALTKELDAYAAAAYTKMGEGLTKDMKKFGKYEADFSARMFDNSTNDEVHFDVPAARQIEAAVLATPLALTVDKQRGTIEDALKEFSKAKRKEMISTIKSGIIAGATNDQIIADVTFVANKIQANHASALVRTVTNQISSLARNMTIEENSDVLEGYEWVSTLDGRTTETCMALDGQVFAIGEGPRPPLHWGCRSTIVPRVKQEYRISDKVDTKRPAVGDEGAEQVSSRMTYGTWLAEQSSSFQNEVLGPERAELFRTGELKVNQFVDDNYRALTLEQLKEQEPMAFEKAGL